MLVCGGGDAGLSSSDSGNLEEACAIRLIHINDE